LIGRNSVSIGMGRSCGGPEHAEPHLLHRQACVLHLVEEVIYGLGPCTIECVACFGPGYGRGSSECVLLVLQELRGHLFGHLGYGPSVLESPGEVCAYVRERREIYVPPIILYEGFFQELLD